MNIRMVKGLFIFQASKLEFSMLIVPSSALNQHWWKLDFTSAYISAHFEKKSIYTVCHYVSR